MRHRNGSESLLRNSHPDTPKMRRWIAFLVLSLLMGFCNLTLHSHAEVRTEAPKKKVLKQPRKWAPLFRRSKPAPRTPEILWSRCKSEKDLKGAIVACDGLIKRLKGEQLAYAYGYKAYAFERMKRYWSRYPELQACL